MIRRIFPGFLLIGMCLGGTAWAGVNVNINIGTPLPPLAVTSPPVLSVVPGTYVYLAPDVGADLVFYQDNWYRPHAGRWFVSVNFNGPWKAVAAPPAAVAGLPQNYRALPPGHERIPYGQVRNNWRTWERDRHWDRDAKREERSDERDDHKGRKHKKHRDDDDHDGDRGGRRHHDD